MLVASWPVKCRPEETRPTWKLFYSNPCHCCFTAHSDLDAETSKKVTDAFLSALLSTEEESRSGTESRSIADEPHPWFDTSGTVALEHFESSEAAHKDHRRN